MDLVVDVAQSVSDRLAVLTSLGAEVAPPSGVMSTPSNRKRGRRRGITAWLVTWEGTGRGLPRGNNRVAAVLSRHLEARNVALVIELLYGNRAFSLGQRVRYALDRKSHSYPAQCDSISGVPWDGRIMCGHNPYLEARRVNNLRVVARPAGGERLEWDERRRPSPPSVLSK